jgi:hypothetical protein
MACQFLQTIPENLNLEIFSTDIVEYISIDMAEVYMAIFA